MLRCLVRQRALITESEGMAVARLVLRAGGRLYGPASIGGWEEVRRRSGRRR